MPAPFTVETFETLTPDQIAALQGHHREAWYSYQRGDLDKARAILAAYPEPAEAAAPAEVETPERDAGAVETPEAKPAATKARARRTS